MQTKTELALEQTQQGVSDEVLKIRVIPHSIHNDNGNPTSANIKQAMRQIRMVLRGSKGHRHPQSCSRLRKGNVSNNKLLCCEPDTAYGLHLIRRISDELDLVVEIDFTWSFGFGSVDPVILPMSVFDKDTKNSYCYVGIILALLLYIVLHFLDDYFCISSSFSGNGTFIVKDLSGQCAVLITQNTPCCLEEQIRHLDYRSQYAVLSRKVDTLYPTGGYGVSVDLSKQET
nr:hypothetical protein [Tanacetum cinerariifolium]